jgi:pilus assembly protein Flp/PilA
MVRLRSLAEACRAFCIRLATARAADERGASLVEYALLLALIAVVCVTAISVLGTNAANKFSNIGSHLQ